MFPETFGSNGYYLSLNGFVLPFLYSLKASLPIIVIRP